MIARPHICLRCQSRLARRSTPSKAQFAFQSTDSRLTPSKIIPDDHDQDGEDFHHTRRPLRLSRRPLGLQNQISEYPLGKLYGYAGQQLRENREKLSIDVLGESAEVIVLRDSRFSNYDYQIEEYVESPEEIDILAQLDEERGLAGWEEVEANINAARPKEGEHPQTSVEFSQLLTELQRGFTVTQLVRYLRSHEQKVKKAPEVISESLTVRISPWVPGVSESDSNLYQDELRGYDLQSYTSKQRLVLRILRECWKLRLPFVEEGIGQIEVEIKPGDLDLLLTLPPISVIHANHIVEKGERLEVIRSRNAIRVTTTRIKSYAIVREIERALKGIHRIKIPLKVLMPKAKEDERSRPKKWVDTQFDDAMIEEVARLTQTDIRKTSGGSLFVSSVDPDAESLSNRTDTAQRLILASGSFSGRETNSVGCKELPNSSDGVLVKYPQTEGLSWRDRLRQWTRWTLPISKAVEKEDEIIQEVEESNKAKETLPPVPIDSGIHDIPGDAVRLAGSDKFADDSPKWWYKGEPQFTAKPDVAYWDSLEDIGVESSAIMGSLLHNQPQSTSPTDFSQTISTIRSFSTTVPNLSQILTNTTHSAGRKPTESVVMRFLPNPFIVSPTTKAPIGSDGLSAFPPIEIRFSVQPESKALRINYIRAVLSTENSDLMLPDSPIDIRFEQRTTSRLHCDWDNLPASLYKFLETSALSLDFENGRLITPPSLTLPIAAHLCNGPGFDLLGLGKKDAEKHDVEYLFAGLEIRRTINMQFQGWRLLYTSVEGGKAGRRRGELRLRPVRIEKSDDPSEETQEAFLESAFALADGSYTPAKARKVISRAVRMVSTDKGKIADRIFRYFAKRPKITYAGGQDDENIEEEPLANDIREAEEANGVQDGNGDDKVV